MPPYDPLVAYDFSSWISRVVGVVKRSWLRLLVLLTIGYLLPLAILIGLAVSMMSGLFEELDSFELGLIEPSLVATCLILALYLYVVARLAATNVATNDAAGQPVRLRDAYRSSLRLGWPTLGWSILAGLLILLGVLMCLLPGLYLLVVFGLLVPVMAFERRSGMTGSSRLVDGNFWPAAGRFALLYAVTFVVSIVLQQATGLLAVFTSEPVLNLGVTPGAVESPAMPADTWPLILVAMLINVVLQLLTEIVLLAGTLVVYAELRGRRQPGLNTAQLAAEVNA